MRLNMARNFEEMMSSTFFFGYMAPERRPIFMRSASSSDTRNPSASSSVMVAPPEGKTFTDTGTFSSYTTMDKVSAPMFARTQPFIFWSFERVT